MTDPGQTPVEQTTCQTSDQTSEERSGAWLRYVPPIAALGTAFVLQVVLVTDLIGAELASHFGPHQTSAAYVIAGLFGLSVAASLEGSAAYLMRLYDLHLMARDSVWLLRLGMLAYVAVSAGLIHWWLALRGLPELIAWMLAAMSGSALFLWSRGSRWKNRQAMLSAGQIDPALVRLPMSSKVLHPVRSVVTIWLISWGRPVRTVDAARRRYDAWTRLRKVRKAGRQTPAKDPASGKQTSRKAAPRTPRQTSPVEADQTSAASAPAVAARPRRTRNGRTRSGGNVRTLRPNDDDTALAGLRQWAADYGRTPSISEVQRLVGGNGPNGEAGRSRAVRLRNLLTGESADDEEGASWAG